MAKTLSSGKLSRLLLVRKATVKSTLLDRMGAQGFLSGEPVAVSPRTWADEHGESHYAYLLKDMSVKQLADIDKWIRTNEPESVTLLPFDDEATIEKVLDNVGLRINKAVE